MTVKKKVATKTVQAQSESLEESVAKETRKPPVTQVVEVVEEVEQPQALEDTSNTPSDISKKKTIEELMSERESLHEEHPQEAPEEKIADTSLKESTPVESEVPNEKRKEVVDELYRQNDVSAKTSDVMPEISMHKKRGVMPIIAWAFIMIVVAIFIGFAILAASGKTNILPSIVAVPTPTSTPIVQATPTPTKIELQRDAISIQVLNGGGVSGAATKMKKLLEDKGYTVSGTGNTKEYSYEQTEIYTKASSSAYISLLESDLSESYSIGSTGATLKDDASYDAQVIVGKE